VFARSTNVDSELCGARALSLTEARARARLRQARAFVAAIDHGSSLVQEIMSCALPAPQRCGSGWWVVIAH
jgi:hypothetical protein